MKRCLCGEIVAENIAVCPSCGRSVEIHRRTIDGYVLTAFAHETAESICYRARRPGTETDVFVRIFKPEAGIDEEKGARLRRELEAVHKLPAEHFVRHLEIGCSSQSEWYRVSEWIDAMAWPDLIASGFFATLGESAFRLFGRIARSLEVLHRSGRIMPHLVFEDILVSRPGPDAPLAVKIDYKLSRFIDPDHRQPTPGLAQLLGCHPDLLKHRPLDRHSDIWALGKLFVDVLAGTAHCRLLADPANAADSYLAEIDRHPLPYRVKVLLRQMLEDEPHRRPGSMAEVAEVFEQVSAESIARAKRRFGHTVGQDRRPWRRGSLMAAAAALVVMLAAGWILQRHYHFGWSAGRRMQHFTERYKGSVAFVLSTYELLVEGRTVHANGGEGTAFLIDRDGYLLTNRHVACPWLNDGELLAKAQALVASDLKPEFRYRIYLWFEGAAAFKPSSAVLPSQVRRIADQYYLENAFRSDGHPALDIAGVLPPSRGLKRGGPAVADDDVALLKIEGRFDARTPLPLAVFKPGESVPRGAPVFALGFPQGSSTQQRTVTLGFSQGTIRRSFENQIQAHLSLHSGNSGGPVIDTDGRVIGIASAIARSLLAEYTDFGLVLPIARARALYQAVRAGQLRWNGEIYPTLPILRRQIFEAAEQGRWLEAMAWVEEFQGHIRDAGFQTLAGAIFWCNRDTASARRALKRALSMDPDNGEAMLLIYLMDWCEGQQKDSPYRAQLLDTDWRSASEFFGHLVRVLEGAVPAARAPDTWDNWVERDWLEYILAQMALKGKDPKAASERLIALAAGGDPIQLTFPLALAALAEAQRDLAPGTTTGPPVEAIRANQRRWQKARQLLGAYQAADAIEDEIEALDALATLFPESRFTALGRLYGLAALGRWDAAAAVAATLPGAADRPSGNRLGTGLLAAQLLHLRHRTDESRKALRTFAHKIADPWYRELARLLLGEVDAEAAGRRAAGAPEYLITLNTALGLRAEADGDRPAAEAHYGAALENFTGNWLEYRLSRERIIRLRQAEAGSVREE